jgi:cardiolipin synthase
MILWVSFVVFAYYDRAPVWLAIIVLSKDVMILGAGLALHVLNCDCSITPNFWGKGASAVQFVLVLCTLVSIGLGWFGLFWANWFFWALWLLAAIVTMVSGVSYALIEARRLNKAG